MYQLKLSTNGREMRLFFPYHPKSVQLASLAGGKFSKVDKCWVYPVCPYTAQTLKSYFPALQLESDLQTALLIMLNSHQNVLDFKDKPTAEPIKTMPIKSTPMGHQIVAYNLGLMFMDNSDQGAGFWMEVGTGKTLVGIALAGRKFLDGEVTKCLVVAPLNAVGVWYYETKQGEIRGEIQKHAGYQFRGLLLDDRYGSTKKVELLEKFVVPDYEGMSLSFVAINFQSVWRPEVYEAIKTWNPNMIIVDEIHRIKQAGAKQSEILHRLGDKAKYRLGLTGTPIGNTELDSYSIYRFLNPKIFGTNKTAHTARYFIMQPIIKRNGDTVKITKTNDDGKKFSYEAKQNLGIKPEMKSEYIRKLHSIAYTVLKKDCMNLPPQVHELRFCQLEPLAQKMYDQMKNKSVAMIGDEKLIAQGVLSKNLRLSQIAGGFLTNHDEPETGQQISKAKMNLYMDELDDLLCAGKKVLTFARFIPEYTAIREALQIMKIGCLCVRGGVKNRAELADLFQTESNYKVFLGQIQAVAESLTLTAADTSIFYSHDYSLLNNEQCLGRNHRRGQESDKVTYIHLLTEGTIDEEVYQALQDKKDLLEDIRDNWRTYA
jgi:superfamily II DNA or RNA helicase